MNKKEKRFTGNAPDEIRAMMRAVRNGKSLAEITKETDKMMGEFLKSLNSIDDEDNNPENQTEMEIYLMPNYVKKKPKKK